MEGAIRVLPSTYEESAVIGPCAEYAECRNATKIVDLWGQTPSVRIVVGRVGSFLVGTALCIATENYARRRFFPTTFLIIEACSIIRSIHVHVHM